MTRASSCLGVCGCLSERLCTSLGASARLSEHLSERAWTSLGASFQTHMLTRDKSGILNAQVTLPGQRLRFQALGSVSATRFLFSGPISRFLDKAHKIFAEPVERTQMALPRQGSRFQSLDRDF